MTNTVLDLINRTPEPAPWSEGDNIPWDDPAFSERELIDIAQSVGFKDAKWFPSLSGSVVSKEKDLPVLVAKK